MTNLPSTHTQESTVQVPSILSGGNQVDISAGNNLTTVASQVSSSGDVNLSAGGKIDYLAALNINRNEEDSKTSRSFAGISIGISIGSSSRNDSTTTVKAAPTQLQSESDILSESGGNTRLQGTQIKAGGSFTANAGVGPKADPNAQILIEGVKEKTILSHSEKDENLMWQSMSGQGSTPPVTTSGNRSKPYSKNPAWVGWVIWPSAKTSTGARSNSPTTVGTTAMKA